MSPVCCTLLVWSLSAPAEPHLLDEGLILDLDAGRSVEVEENDRVVKWTNQVASFAAKDFVKQDRGRKEPGSGRPTLRRSVPAIGGRDAIVFERQELVNHDEDAFDHLITGRGYTWFAVLAVHPQVVQLKDVNSFFGNLRNGGNFEGIWGNVTDDNRVWIGSRNGITFGRWDANNPMVVAPKPLDEGRFHVVAGRMGAGTGDVPIELFIDDPRPVAAGSFPVNPAADSSKFAIGQERDAINHPGKESFDGELARFLIYERPLTDAELKQTVEYLKETYAMPQRSAFPGASLSNDVVAMDLYLPEPGKGYYRGTRFDGSGIISSLRFRGHEYFGEWKEGHDPENHDDICGPVEAFQTGGAGLGYEEAKPGESFVRIGVGVLRKPDEPGYRWNHTYEIIDPGRWAVKHGTDWIEFRHELSTAAGWGYVYTKRIALTKEPPGFTIAHVLENTGTKAIDTDQFNHNFFVIDGQPTGPDFVVRFPFPVRATEDGKGLVETRGRELLFRKEFTRDDMVGTALEGFGSDVRDHRIAIENRKTGAGVRIACDRPLERMYFWTIRPTICPEPYIRMNIAPGSAEKWTIRYELYVAGD
ncbi:MAG: hypothetical protein JXP34_18815 [Planctomycetes bacterium]|nr:hypothetical protein [Planctomycetota bacterium]